MLLEQRLSQLERENRKLKWCFRVALVVPFLGFSLGAMQNGVSPSISTERLNLVDSRGNTVLYLMAEEPTTRGPSIGFLDSNGRGRLAMGVANNQGSIPYIQFDDSQGRRVLNIATGNPRPGIVRVLPDGRIAGVAP